MNLNDNLSVVVLGKDSYNNGTNFTIPSIDYLSLGYIQMYKVRVPYDLPICILSVILNMFLLLVFCKRKLYMKQYILHISIIIGDILNAIAYFGYHMTRFIYGMDLTLLTNYECFVGHLDIPLILLGKQLCTGANLSIGLESIIAVKKPIWFKTNYSGRG